MPVPRAFAERLTSLLRRGRGSGRYVPLTSSELDERFQKAVIGSAIVHLVFLFGITFKPANPDLLRNDQMLEVVLVNARSQAKPLKPDVLAQYSLDGGGEVEEDRQARSPLPASEQDSQASVATAEAQVKALEEKARELLTTAKSDHAVAPTRPEAPNDARPTPTLPNPVDLIAASLEMARLQARIDQDWQAYQKRPRRAFVGARAQEYGFARYVEDWRLKVERIGNLNYPEAARRQRIYGTLVLTVNIKADGSLENIQIDRSSGSKVLDAAAVKIVEMAAPFSPFTAEMRNEIDILGITRAWQFTNSELLTSGKQ